jgi:hypothetical protein
LYPPVAVGLPRVAPKGGAEVCGRYVPGGVSQHIQGKKNLLILCRRLSKPPCSAPIDLQQISRTPTYSIPSETCPKMQLNTNLIEKTRWIRSPSAQGIVWARSKFVDLPLG